jgi:hypothetical protein
MGSVVSAVPRDATGQAAELLALYDAALPEVFGGMVFAIRDPEQNIWSFGSYGLGSG